MGLDRTVQRLAKRQTPTGWKARHLWVLVLATAAVLALAESRSEWSPMHQWNRAFGDASLLLVALAMAIGPLARLWPRMRRFLPWRRELGVWGTLLAIVHTAIILDGWLQWNLIRMVGYELHPGLGDTSCSSMALASRM